VASSNVDGSIQLQPDSGGARPSAGGMANGSYGGVASVFDGDGFYLYSHSALYYFCSTFLNFYSFFYYWLHS
jgi:hypothetical protein